MPHNDPWWINLAGVGFGLIIWLGMALIWLAGMAALYGVFLLLGPQAMIVCGVMAFACGTYIQAARIKEDDDRSGHEPHDGSGGARQNYHRR